MTVDARVAALEAKVQELEAMLTLALRLLSVERPVSAILERFGATEAEDLAVHELLDSLAGRAQAGCTYRRRNGLIASAVLLAPRRDHHHGGRRQQSRSQPSCSATI